MFRILDWNAFHNLKPLFNLETVPHAFFRRILIDCGIWISHLTVCLGEEFGAVIWGAAGIWASGFINYPVWHHKFPISMWDLLLGFVTHKYHLKIPSKHRISDIHQARDFFFFCGTEAFTFLYLSLSFYFFFSSYSDLSQPSSDSRLDLSFPLSSFFLFSAGKRAFQRDQGHEHHAHPHGRPLDFQLQHIFV